MNKKTILQEKIEAFKENNCYCGEMYQSRKLADPKCFVHSDEDALVELLESVAKDAYSEGSAFKGKAVREAYMQGCRETREKTIEELSRAIQFSPAILKKWIKDSYLQGIQDMSKKATEQQLRLEKLKGEGN